MTTPGAKLQAMRPIRTVICAHCGAEFTARDTRAKWCSNRCRQAAKYQRQQSQEITMNAYKVGNKEFSKISEAKAYARASLIGTASDSHVMIYERESASVQIGGGFWNPIARAEWRGNKIIVPR